MQHGQQLQGTRRLQDFLAQAQRRDRPCGPPRCEKVVPVQCRDVPDQAREFCFVFAFCFLVIRGVRGFCGFFHSFISFFTVLGLCCLLFVVLLLDEAFREWVRLLGVFLHTSAAMMLACPPGQTLSTPSSDTVTRTPSSDTVTRTPSSDTDWVVVRGFLLFRLC
jgi:hypothetical protein